MGCSFKSQHLKGKTKNQFQEKHLKVNERKRYNIKFLNENQETLKDYQKRLKETMVT